MISPALDKFFPADTGIKVIAEPGRFYVASAYTLVVNIIAKKAIVDDESASDGNSHNLGGHIYFDSMCVTFLSIKTLFSAFIRGRRRDQ